MRSNQMSQIMDDSLRDLTTEAYNLEPMEATFPTVTSVCLTIIFSLIFLASSLLNTLFLIIFFRRPSLRNISNRFIVNLTLGNLVSSWLLLPIAVTDMFLKGWRPAGGFETLLNLPDSSAIWCTIFNVIADFTTSASIFGTVLIAVDRLLAITDPLHYHMLVTRCRSWLLILLGWFMAGIVGTFSALVTDNRNRWNICIVPAEKVESPSTQYYYWAHLTYGIVSFLLCFALPFFIISWAYSKIYAAAQQNSERARRSSLCNANLEIVDPAKAVSRSSSTRSTSSQFVSNIRRRFSNASLFLYKEEARAAKISLGVMALFIFCWFPFYLTKIIDASFGEDQVAMVVYKVVLIFTLLNSAISPYVYMYRSERIQKEVLRLFGMTFKSKRKAYEKRSRPIYHQLSASNIEKMRSCSSAQNGCLEIQFKIDAAPPEIVTDDEGEVFTNNNSTTTTNHQVESSNKKLFVDLFRGTFFRNWNKGPDISTPINSCSNSSTYSCSPSTCYLSPATILKYSPTPIHKSKNYFQPKSLPNSLETSHTLTSLLSYDQQSKQENNNKG